MPGGPQRAGGLGARSLRKVVIHSVWNSRLCLLDSVLEGRALLYSWWALHRAYCVAGVQWIGGLSEARCPWPCKKEACGCHGGLGTHHT